MKNKFQNKLKKERIDKQYYVLTKENNIQKDSAEEMLITAENFILKLKLVITELNQEQINKLKNKFEQL